MNLAFGGEAPDIDPSAFIASGVKLIGNVKVGEDASIWYNCVIRADVNLVRIGARTNIQDGTVVHCDSAYGDHPGYATLIGDDVLVGHMAMLHGCVLHDRAFVGLGAIVMDGCEIESHGMLAAGALLTPGKVIRQRQLWAGRPAKYVRDISDAELEGQALGIVGYVELARRHRQALQTDPC
jgi:carbonic anhydrase/acetyltransferase-like protein (isoleucine patch superfamily)